MDPNENITKLPFPCVEDATTPVESIYKFHEDGDPKTSRDYYFTMAIDKFRPSPCTFLDTALTQVGEAHKLMLIIIFHLLDRMFYGDEPDVINIPNVGGRRFRIFMEYLLSHDTDPEDFTLIDCVGIRFHINIYDTSLDFNSGILKMIETNSGNEGNLVSDGNGGDDMDEGVRKKRKRKGQKPEMSASAKKKLPVSEDYKLITTTIKWLRLCGIVSNYNDSDTYTTNTDNNYAPKEEHPFHADNLFSWKNSLIPGMKEEQEVSGPNFAFPQAVYYINGYMTTPHGILGVILPRTPIWFKQADRGMMMETLQSLNNKDFMDRIFERQLRNTKRNDLLEIRQVQDKRRERLLLTTHGDNKNRALRMFRERSVKYLATSWNPIAFVSDPIKVMAKTAGDFETWHCGVPTITDIELSSFGNFIVDTMFAFENLLRISTTHTVLLRVIINALDAYRYEFNLHNNVLLVGAGATGKSHILEVLENVIFVDGTVNKVSHMTDKAVTGDRDKNDLIWTYHEMPPILQGSNNKPGDSETGSGIIKDMMTSGRVETQTIHVEDGRRTEYKVKSERVGVLIMASNNPSDKIPEALATRMSIIQVNSDSRQKFTINDMTSSIDGVSGGEYFEESDKVINFKRKWKIRQMLVNMVEKMIYVGCLLDVNIRVFETVQLKMTEYMRTHDIMQRVGNDREIKFLKRFARTLTIVHAVDKFISDPRSPGYDPNGVIKFGSQESFDTLLSIQPYLFCTEEIALFAMSLNADQLIAIHHFRALEVILACVKNTLVKSGDGTNELKDGFWITRSCYPDERFIYRKLAAAQNNDTFKTKMSAENIKVAFRELRRRVFDGIAVIEFSTSTQSIGINASFVNKHFKWDDSIQRYVCSFDLNNIMTDVFYKSYANTHTKEQKKSLIGVVYDRDLPFLFDTMHKKQNPDHVLTRCIARSNNDKKMNRVETTSEYERFNDTVKFKINFEDFCYKKYLEKCGYDIEDGDFSVNETLYKHHVSVATEDNTNYPNDQIDWFVKFTGIKPERYKNMMRRQEVN